MKIITSLKDFLEKDRVKTIFDHLRNLFYCALIIAAGAYVHDHPPEWALRISAREVFGYPIIAIGVLLMLLNLADGIYKLSKPESGRWYLQVVKTGTSCPPLHIDHPLLPCPVREACGNNDYIQDAVSLQNIGKYSAKSYHVTI
jgi:hypothetical protein